MKPNGILINASRGTVVDIDALAKAVNKKHLIGTAIDIFPVEPKSNRDEFKSPLRGLDNAILTPHLGGSTQEAQENIGVKVAEKLVRYSDNGSTLKSVNCPEVAIPPLTQTTTGYFMSIKIVLGCYRQPTLFLRKIKSITDSSSCKPPIRYVVIDVDRDY